MHDHPTPAEANPAPADTGETPVAEVAADVVAGADAAADTAAAAQPAKPALPGLSPAACAAQLAALFPAIFGPGGPKPLKLRIQVDIQQRAPSLFTKKVLSLFLQRHTTSTAYLKALVNAPHRLDLDGQPAGEPADEHRQAAVAELERRRALHDARRAAERDTQRQTQRKAHDEARRAYMADAEARGKRDTLLRAFETTTLTRKNFCALKGVAEAELDAVLAQARQEREQQRAQAPRPEQRPADRRRPDAPSAERGLRPDRAWPPHPRAPSAAKPQR